LKELDNLPSMSDAEAEALWWQLPSRLCRISKNPTRRQFATALRSSSSWLRGLLTQVDLYVWRDPSHSEFERKTGIEGMRLILRTGQVQANDESAALPEHFPWVFPDRERAETMDIEDRRKVVADYLQANVRLKRVYPTGFTVVWYS
jgi:hypothetical protein